MIKCIVGLIAIALVGVPALAHTDYDYAAKRETHIYDGRQDVPTVAVDNPVVTDYTGRVLKTA